MTLKQIANFYKIHSYFYDWTRWVFLFNRKKTIDLLRLKQGDSVICVGCGTGHNLKYIMPKIGKKGKAAGVDYSKAMLNQARKKIFKNGWQNINLIQADAANYKSNQKADAILYSFSLSMISDWKNSLICSYKHLKPRGRIVIIDFFEFKSYLKWANTLLNWWLKRHNVNNKLPVSDFCKEKK